MEFDPTNYAHFRGDVLKQRLLAQFSDGDVTRASQRLGTKFLIPGTTRVNLFKARDAFKDEALAQCHPRDPGVSEIVRKWADMAGLTPGDAVFWQEHGFMAAIRAGRDVCINRYLDDDGWGWLVVRDQPSNWLSKARLPESTVKQLAKRAVRR